MCGRMELSDHPQKERNLLRIMYQRSVGNVSFLYNILEKAVLKKINDHVESQSHFPDYHSNYRQSFSCQTAMVKLINDILWAMEHQEVTAVMAIYLSAAFDIVDHEILLEV